MSKTALFKAARAWDAETVRALLGVKPELAQARDSRGRTALHLCAGRPLVEAEVKAGLATAAQLLDAGVDTDAVEEIPDDGDVFPATALWYAVARGRNLELVRFLLKAGADPDNCLWAVVWADDAPMARLLLDAGSNTELRFDGDTPLLYAARLGREAALQELLRAGADIRVHDAKGRSPLDLARKRRLPVRILNALDPAHALDPAQPAAAAAGRRAPS
ncbi:MAG: ankyrin repeat domain-containing protein [Burkholderiaceae bacterium]